MKDLILNNLSIIFDMVFIFLTGYIFYKLGEKVGKGIGYEDGYQAGEIVGYDNGYDEGFAEGKEDERSNRSDSEPSIFTKLLPVLAPGLIAAMASFAPELSKLFTGILGDLFTHSECQNKASKEGTDQNPNL